MWGRVNGESAVYHHVLLWKQKLSREDVENWERRGVVVEHTFTSHFFLVNCSVAC